MSLIEGNGLSAADVAAVTGGGGGGGMFGRGGYGDGLFWIIILFLFAAMGGWGNGFGGGNGGGGAVNYYNGVQEGFNQASVMNGISAIQAAQSANQAALLQNLNASQIANNQSMNTLAMSLQNCCCENRAGLADLKYTVATENCADRSAAYQNTRDIIDSQTRGTQAILDKLCQLELDGVKAQVDAKNDRIAELQTQLNMANLAASQTAQTARLLQDNAAQTMALEQYLNPTPIPAYVVQNPNCCQQNYGCGCGCGSVA